MRRAVLALVLWTAPIPALAADDRLLEAADGYFQCAAFYKGALDAGVLPEGRKTAEIETFIAKAAEVATGLGITAREGPRRMTSDEVQTMHRRIAVKAQGHTQDFRADPAGSRRWIAEGFAHCDEKMGYIGK